MAKATFEMYEDRAGKWRWRLIHDNGNIIADSGEGYASRQKCEQGLESVKRNAADAEVEQVNNPSGEIE
ncbi:MAG: HVO_2922 family protein [Natronomonas sp.]